MTSTTMNTSTIAGIEVPSVAIGTWSWGDKAWGYKSEMLGDIKESWRACNDAGMTFYDTAEMYGRGMSEKIIGDLLKETDEETRKKLFIATKWIAIPGAMRFWLFRPPIVQALKESLCRLGLDHVDLYMIHSSAGIGTYKQWADGLAECYKLGLCKAVGVSNFSKEEVILFSDILAKYGIPLACNQVEYSLIRQLPGSSGLFAEMKKRNITLLAYSPLAMGRLTGKYSKTNPMPSGRPFSNKSVSWEDMDPLLGEMKTLADKYNVTMSAIALNWVICKGAIALGGARNAKQATENAKALSFRMTDAEVESLGKKGFKGKLGGYGWQRG